MEPLIYGEEYYCFFKDEYIGTATFIDDPYIGDSFAMMMVDKRRGLEELFIMPDYWVMKTEQDS